MNLPFRIHPLSAAMLLTYLAGGASAQTLLLESFDNVGSPGGSGPSGLVSRGWTFRNQSVPIGTQNWFQGYTPAQQSYWPNPQSGAGYVAVSSTSTAMDGTVSNWAILPAVPGQQAGHELRFWVLGWDGSNVNTMQVRYSPSGGISTGSGTTGLGDFTTLLLDMDPVPGPGWNLVSITLPGPGRIALRSYIPFVEAFGFQSYTGVDSLSVGTPPPAPCNLPPVPTMGQSLTWTAAGGPYRVCENISIPPGATVTVEPGAVVNFDSGKQLNIAGTLKLQGTAASRITINGAANFPPMIAVDNGTLESTSTDFQGGQLRVNSGATVKLTGSTISGANGSFIVQEIQTVTPFVHLVGCTFTGIYMTISDAISILENNTFINTNPWLLRGYADVTATNTLSGGIMRITREESIQPFLVDGVHASGSPRAGLDLGGGTFRVGPNTVLTNNAYPISLLGGLTSDSTIPQSGNANNAIDVGNGGFMGEGLWPNLGLTYRLTEPTTSFPGGNLAIEPGVTVEAAHPNAGMIFRSTRYTRILGEPERPITFRGLNGQTWGGLAYFTNATTGGRLDHCIIENARFGVSSSDNWLFVDSTLLRNNQVGANANTYGVISFAKTRFTQNSTGISYTDLGSPLLSNISTPNSVAGNAVGVDAFEPQPNFEDLTKVWWGSSSGPTIAGNPGGTGDSIVGIGAAAVLYSPFLTSAPDAANHPPVVRLQAPGLNHYAVTPDTMNPDFLLERGTKYILHWTVDSDDAITSQRIEFSPDGVYPSRYTILADNIPPTARSWEVTIPNPGFAASNSPQVLKVVATDAAGQVGFDHVPVSVPSDRMSGNINITTNLAGQTFTPGQAFPNMQWTGTASYFPTLTPMIILESDGDTIMGINVSGIGGMFFIDAPYISTDRARLALMARNNSNDIIWFFTPGYFSIRHDPRLGFAPPQVALTSPTPSQTFPGAGTIPISWTASAAEGLRSFDIMASYDAGRSWHIVARNLPSSARSYNWQLPPSTGISELRLRVIARDQRFQNSSTSDITIAITPGSTAPCYANCDLSSATPLLTANDFQCFLNKFAAADPYANCDGVGGLTANDFQCFLNRFAAGCPR
jgi:hypothetical protein